jgi:hypothetical protein
LKYLLKISIMKRPPGGLLEFNSLFFKMLFILSLAFIVNNKEMTAQKPNELNVIRNNWLQYSDATDFLYHHVTGQAYDQLARRASEIARLSSLSDWQQRQKKIAETLLDIVGPFPEKTPLNAKIVRTLAKDGFRVEHIIYESQPGFYVTSSMFIPSALKKGSRGPAVIYCSGHSADGYRSTVYQHVIINLVKKGFIVFAFDPVGQGERYAYLNAATGKPTPGMSEHSYPGSQAFITGSSQARYMIWDGIRAVDYLLTRKEVDPARIGITGRSGGGTQSAYIAAIDDRIYAAAPENYLTTFTRLLQTIGPQDAEQNMFNVVARGIDQPDFLLVRAPKPALMITTTRDIFSIQGVRENEQEVRRIYKAYGKEDNFGRTEDDAPHESTRKNREAMYVFFQKHLNNPGNPNDEETQILSVEEIQVTATGQVSTSLGGETVFSLNRKEAEKLENKLQASRADLPLHISTAVNSAKKLSGYREPSGTVEPVFTGRFQMEGYVIEKYFLKGEGDYVIPYLLLKPDRSNDKSLIYLHPAGKSVNASPGGEMEWFARNGFTVLSPDLLGIGETGYRDTIYDHTYIRNWFGSMMIGRSIVGIRAGDVVRLCHVLEKNNETGELYALARKEMAPVLLHAAAFYPAIKRIALVEPYSSYLSIVTNRFYKSGFIYSTVPGALKAYDLPDLAASLAPRKLLIAGITDGNGENAGSEDIISEFDLVKTAYRNKNADGQLNIVKGELSGKPYPIFLEWIK